MIQSIFTLALVAAASVVGAGEGNLRVQAVDLIAAMSSRPAAMQSVVAEASVEYPSTGRGLRVHKVRDRGTGATTVLAYDGAGTVVDAEAAFEAELDVRQRLQGKIEPRLAARLVAGGVPQLAMIRVRLEAEQPLMRLLPEEAVVLLDTPERVLAARRGIAASRRAQELSVVEPVEARMRLRGVEVLPERAGCYLYAMLDREQARTIADWQEVESISACDPMESQMNVARQVIGATPLNNLGVVGTGARVGLIEVGARIATSNPYLAGIGQGSVYECASPTAHSTAIAGILKSTHGTHRGVATGAAAYMAGSCSGWPSELLARSEAVVANWGADILNLSWGSDYLRRMNEVDRYYDALVHDQFVTVMAAAGNSADAGGTANVLSPGMAYNVITVGSIDDRGTTTFADDTMSTFSSFRDPLSESGDRQKPELVAPGTNISTASVAYPWSAFTGSGTSASAPQVAGLAAMLVQRDPSLAVWPEGIKAILMAGAMRNIEGSTRLSDRDGAGLVQADRADRIVTGTLGAWGGQAYGCGSAAETVVATIPLVAGKRTRVAMAWNVNPAYSGWAVRPNADLDLGIRSPAGAYVVSSDSWDNPYEIVDFVPASSGTYQVVVYNVRCSSSPGYIAWAWTRDP